MVERRAIEQAVAALDRRGQVVGVTELVGGTSADVHRVDYRDASGQVRHVVFRQHRSAGFKGHAQQVTAIEHRVLDGLWRRGFEVPRPVLLDDSGTFTPPFLVTEWVAGSTEVAPTHVDDALDQMADFLGRLHDLDPMQLDVADLATLEEPLTALADHLPDDQLGARLLRALASGEITRAANRPVLIHGDFWPGNVIWADGRLAAVIDWEDVQIGDPLADLACARVELRCQYGMDAQLRFTERYLAESTARGTELDIGALPLWDAYVSASALKAMERWGLDPAEETRRRTATHEFFREAASELLDSPS